MPVDYDDLETDSADGEKKVSEGESYVDLDYPTMSEKTQDELESLMSTIRLTDDKENADDQDDEIISRAPIGGIPVTFVNNYNGVKALKNCPSFDPNFCNSYDLDSKPKRSFAESEYHAVKYKKPTENSDSLLQQQCSILQNVIINTHQTSGGIVTIAPSPSLSSTEEYDSGFSPGESIYDSSPPTRVELSPSSDYSSMASPDSSYKEVTLDLESVKTENSNDDCVFDDIKLSDVNEIIEKELNFTRIKEEKERLEKELREDGLCEDGFVAFSPPQFVPGQGSMLSSSPPSLYNPVEFNVILEDLYTNVPLPSQQNPAPDQQQVFPPQQQPVTTYTQSHQPSLVNSNHRQFTQQQQQPPLVASPSHLQYNVQPQHVNVLSNTPTQQQHYSAQQIIATTGSQPQYVVPKPQVSCQPQQPILTPSLLRYSQQNAAAPIVSNQHFVSQRPAQVTQSNKQYPVALQPITPNQQPRFSQPQETQLTTPPHFAVHPPSQIITTTANQPFTRQSIATTQQHSTSPTQHRVTASQSLVTGCAIQASQPSIPQLTPVVPRPPSNPSVGTPKNSGLPSTSTSDQNGIAMPTSTANSNNAVIIVTQPANSSNPIMLVPTTTSQLIYMSPVPVPKKQIRPAPRQILPKPANGDPNGNRVDLTKLPAQTVKGRRDKDKSSQPTEIPGQGNLGVARRCVAAMRDEHLENTSEEGDNYLHVAVCKTDVYMIEALLERLDRSGKLDLINRQNRARQTPVYLAVSANQPAMVHKLIRYGADVNVKGMMHGYQNERVERAPIHCAASKGKEYYDTLKELFKSEKMDPDVLNSDGLSALHCAIIEHGKLIPSQTICVTKIDNCQNVALLLKHKANPNLPDRCNGKTPLMYALESKDYAMVETILKGVESSKIPELFSTRTFDGRTCVMIADGLRNEYDPLTWRKLQNFFANVH